ncbi:hypothetical protein NDU88_005896 [Pleurodeles waltl]|uniref:Uncharacterized protein n=1 Tax=Pleurodeles waltl TaxID=8319 RepID=A0AAV7VN67_PLEWA|nr:hypothetical protein NDU88_005896 [Pleurodeles waltl]
MHREAVYELPFVDYASLNSLLGTPRNAAALGGAQALEHECSLGFLGDELSTLAPAKVEYFLSSIIPYTIGDFKNDSDF